MPRYVILHHETPRESPRPAHWDLMLEVGDALQTWAVEEEIEAGKSCTAQRLADHRLDYLTYEGPVSNNRGRVKRSDAGVYELLSETPDNLQVQLCGGRLQGVLVLTRLETGDGDAQRWSVSLRNN